MRSVYADNEAVKSMIRRQVLREFIHAKKFLDELYALISSQPGQQFVGCGCGDTVTRVVQIKKTRPIHGTAYKAFALYRHYGVVIIWSEHEVHVRRFWPEMDEFDHVEIKSLSDSLAGGSSDPNVMGGLEWTISSHADDGVKFPSRPSLKSFESDDPLGLKLFDGRDPGYVLSVRITDAARIEMIDGATKPNLNDPKNWCVEDLPAVGGVEPFFHLYSVYEAAREKLGRSV
jgi:hypothetical protein